MKISTRNNLKISYKSFKSNNNSCFISKNKTLTKSNNFALSNHCHIGLQTIAQSKQI